MVSSSSRISTAVQSGEAKGGDLRIKSGKITMERGRLESNSRQSNLGGSGDIWIEAGELSLSDRAVINSTTAGRGKGGNVSVLVDQISLDAGAGIYSESLSRNETYSGGDGGVMLVA